MKDTTAKFIENARLSIEKLEKKIARVQEALDGGKNPYRYGERDMRIAKKDLEKAKDRLSALIKKGDAEDCEENEPRIAAIESFLANWKRKATVFYTKSVDAYNEYQSEIRQKKKALEEDFKSRNVFLFGKEMRAAEKEVGIDYQSTREYIEFHFDLLTVDVASRGNQAAFLEEVLEKEVYAKRTSLISRVKDTVGEIVDASGLYVADDGEINGVVIGTKGNARVTTISAGGYNIQCFHFRVLVKSV